jgi:hypothetical protein
MHNKILSPSPSCKWNTEGGGSKSVLFLVLVLPASSTFFTTIIFQLNCCSPNLSQQTWYQATIWTALLQPRMKYGVEKWHVFSIFFFNPTLYHVTHYFNFLWKCCLDVVWAVTPAHSCDKGLLSHCSDHKLKKEGSRQVFAVFLFYSPSTTFLVMLMFW